MRKKLLTAVLCMGSLAMQAQSQLVVKTTDGSTEKFALAENPKVEFSVTYGKTWVTVGDKVKKLDIKSLQLEDLPTETGVMVVINVDGGKVMVPAAELKTIITKTFDEGAEHLPNVIASDPSVSIYNAALVATHMKDSLMRYMDVCYGFANEQDRLDSCYWNNDKLVLKSVNEYNNIAYPEKRYYKYTALLVPDAVLKEKYGITSLDDLRAKAHELYDPMYPEDANVTDETDRRNALNRFISYHLLPFQGYYFKLTAFDKGRLQYNFNREKADITDWYETMMPHSLIKFSFPAGTDEGIYQEGLYVNRRGVKTGADDRGVFVRGARVTQVPYKMYEDGSGIKPYIAENGTYHYIDEIVAYDQQMQQVVCNDRMRIDCTTLSPDFMTSGARGHSTRVVTEADGDMYGQYSTNPYAETNPNTCLAFKADYIENFEFPITFDEYFNDFNGNGSHTSIYVSNRYLSSWSYQGDDIQVYGQKYGAHDNVKMKLPPLPAGKYELRLGTVVGLLGNTPLNLYIDDNLVGDDIDLCADATTLCEWRSDTDLGNEEAIAAHDKAMREKGWMKGTGEYTPDGAPSSMRNLSTTLRRIVGTFETDGKTDHYLRLQQQSHYGQDVLRLDYIELIPVSLIENENIY